MNLKSTFKSKKILITGHTGFKGSWMAHWLLKMGADVYGYALKPQTVPNIFDVLGLAKRLNSKIADVRDYDELETYISQVKPDFIFHMAAQPLVRYSYQEPKYTYEVNVMGTVNLFEAVRKNQLKTIIVNITTDKCYENKEWDYGYRELDPLGGYDTYSSSKACSEILTSSYRNSFFNPKDYAKTHHVAVASGRAGNVIGGGDWSGDRLVPDCIKAFSQNQEVEIRNPHATRPWQHVLEPVRGYLELAVALSKDASKYAEAWNFGPGEDAAIDVGTLLGIITKNWQGKVKNVSNKTEPYEASFLKLDLSKTANRLKFKPVLSIDEAVTMTIDWYKAFYDGNYDLAKFTDQQIEKYTCLFEDKSLTEQS
jgi:CDP-glucose 4,6-dehydratase